MMYGFGDDPQPYAESVDLIEDLVVQYITDMVKTTLSQRSAQVSFSSLSIRH